ncbi:MAG: hypothetical protein CM1200mP30_09830 [Pseudomonadota bacterium]|nr:MAG: hypothetical protein CM1200mP30_09830 [Pseudomonadota bacterium]
MIVDPISGTTRDPVDSLCVYQGQEILLVDTAGIRRRGKGQPKNRNVQHRIRAQVD